MTTTQMLIAEQLSKLGRSMPLFKGPLLCVFVFRFPAPTNITKARRFLMHNCPRKERPDKDNLVKYIGDALNGIIWADDAQITVQLSMKLKTFEKEGSTRIFIRELPPTPINIPAIVQELLSQVELYDPVSDNGTDANVRDNQSLRDDGPHTS